MGRLYNMAAKENSGIRALVHKIEQARKIDEKGKVSFSGWEFGEYTDLLVSIIEPSINISEFEKYRLTRRAIFSAGSKGPLTLETIQQEIHGAIGRFLATPQRKYRVITSISVVNELLPKSLSCNGCTIFFPKYLPRRIDDIRMQHIDSAQKRLSCKIESSYSIVDVHVSARSDSDAIEIAFKSLGIVRGIWNYSLNIGAGRTYYTGKRKPVNKILLGPVHTVYSDRSDKDRWWFEEEFNAISVLMDEKRTTHMRKIYNIVMRRIKNSSFYEDLTGSFIRYSDALDSIDCSSSMLKLWGELEFLTSCRHLKQDRVINRASFIFKDREFATLELCEIRKRRNFFAHEGKEALGLKEHYVHIARKYVENLLQFIVNHCNQLNNLEEFCHLLDLQDDVPGIKRKICILNKACRMLS